MQGIQTNALSGEYKTPTILTDSAAEQLVDQARERIYSEDSGCAGSVRNVG